MSSPPSPAEALRRHALEWADIEPKVKAPLCATPPNAQAAGDAGNRVAGGRYRMPGPAWW